MQKIITYDRKNFSACGYSFRVEKGCNKFIFYRAVVLLTA